MRDQSRRGGDQTVPDDRPNADQVESGPAVTASFSAIVQTGAIPQTSTVLETSTAVQTGTVP